MNHVRRFLLLLLLGCAFGALPAAGQILETFYVPTPAAQARTWAQAIQALPENEEIHSVISIIVTTDGTIIYYDQWENGFDRDIADPDNQFSAGNPGDLLDQGDVLVLEDEVPVSEARQ